MHDLIVHYRSQPTFDQNIEQEMYNDIKSRVGNVKMLLSRVFMLDGIIFAELLNDNLNALNVHL